VLQGGGAVRVVRFSPDGSLVFVGGDGGARLYDLRNHFAVRRLATPPTKIMDAAFSPDGSMVAGAAGGKGNSAAYVWDVQTGAPLQTLKHDGPVLSVAFSPNGRWIATGSADHTARLWDAATGLQLGAPFVHQPGATVAANVRHVSFSPDSRRLLTVGGNRFARVFDVARHEEVFPSGLNHLALVNSAAFSHDGKLIATAGGSTFVRVWDAATGKQLKEFEGTGQVNDLAFSPDDTMIATAGSNDTLARVWDLAKGSSVAIITAHRGDVTSVDFTPDGQSVVTAGRDKKALMAQTTGGIPQASLVGHRGAIVGASVSPDGKLIATASEDGTARLWDATVGPVGTGGFPPAEGRLVGKHDLPKGAKGPVVAFSPDGRTMLSAGADGSARLWGRGTPVILKHDGPVNSASFSTDGKSVVTASDDGTAAVWRVADGRRLALLPHGAPVKFAFLTPNGRLAVTVGAGADGRVRVWSVPSASLVRTYFEPTTINDAQLSRDGRLVVIGSADGTAAVLGVTAKSTRVLRGHSSPVVAVAFSPDGRHVATGASGDFAARVWDIRKGTSRELVHEAGLIALAFNRDGSFLATASSDAEVHVWSRKKSWATVAVLLLHSGTVTDLAFSADGRWLASAGPLAAGIWETRSKGAWPEEPLYLVHAASPPSLRLDHVAFSPRGWRLLMGYRNGGVFLYNCTLCGGVKQLTGIARRDLRAIARPKG
jgi:WD40 repeat protein